MQITFSPVRGDAPLELERRGDALIVNGAPFDFTILPEGAELPAEAVDSAFFLGTVRRADGVLHLTIALPHGPDAPVETRFPEPVTASEDGPIELPPYSAEAADV